MWNSYMWKNFAEIVLLFFFFFLPFKQNNHEKKKFFILEICISAGEWQKQNFLITFNCHEIFSLRIFNKNWLS